MGQAAMATALIYNACVSALDVYPLDETTLQQKSIGTFVEGDVNLEMELQGMLHGKSTSFTPVDISLIIQCVQEHAVASNSNIPAAATMTVAANNLENQDWSDVHLHFRLCQYLFAVEDRRFVLVIDLVAPSPISSLARVGHDALAC